MKSRSRLLFTTFIVGIALTGCQGNFDQRLKAEAQRYTQKHCPQRLDGVTLLDSVSFDIASRTWTRYMTIPADVAAITKSKPNTVKSLLLTELKNDASLKTCKDHAINFCYVYREEKTALPVLSITLTATDYTSSSSR